MTDIPNTQPDSRESTILDAPDRMISVRDVFGIDIDMKVPAFSEADERVPDLDPAYVFDPDTTLAILAGFAHNRRVMVQGYHGTGKSTHIEQVAARLNWPCIRINLDAHISRIDLIGRDAIVLRDGQQVTEFREGLLPWALQTPTALVFDEYDAGPPRRDVRDPARAGDRGQADPARPEPRDPPEPVVPPVRDRQHGRPRRHQRAVSRHPADQPGPDGPLEHRRRRSTICPPRSRRRSSSPSRASTTSPTARRRSTTWSASPT